MAGIPWFTGGPELLAKGQRAQRQVQALSTIAAAPGYMIRRNAQASNALAAGQAEETALEQRLGTQQRTAVQQSQHPDEQTNAGTGASATASADIQPTVTPDVTDTLGRYAKGAGNFLARGLGFVTGPGQDQLNRIATLKGQLGRRQDQLKALSSLSGVLEHSANPDVVIKGVAPDLNIPDVVPKPEKADRENTAGLLVRAAKGDPEALKALQLRKQFYGSPPPEDLDVVTEDRYLDAAGRPTDMYHASQTQHVRRKVKSGSLNVPDTDPDVVNGVRIAK